MFNEVFVDLLQQKGITAYRVAKETGISQGLMNQYKNGGKTPTTENLIKIAEYFDCSIDFLLGRKKEETKCREASSEEQLLSAFRKLTADGQAVALNQVEALADLRQYQKYTDTSEGA